MGALPQRDDTPCARIEAADAMQYGSMRLDRCIGRVAVAGATSLEHVAGDGWADMSKRFLRWAETWIEDNIPPGANPDVETYEARAKRLLEKMMTEAAAAGFNSFETNEERERIAPLVRAAVEDTRDWDVDAYVLKSQLARENEDGD